MKPLEPVLTLHLFPEEGAALLKLLASLSAPKWDLQTVCSGWSVKDIAAHLLADDLGRLARGRDAYPRAAFAPSSPENIEAQLLEFINQQNESWVAAQRKHADPGANGTQRSTDLGIMPHEEFSS